MLKRVSIVLAIVVAVLLIIVTLAIFAFGSVFKEVLIDDCNGKIDSVNIRAEPQIEKFKKTVILDSQPNVDTSVSVVRECIDSSPLVIAEKRFAVNKNSKLLLEDAVRSLSSQGYVQIAPDVSEKCVDRSTLFAFKKEEVLIQLDFNELSISDPCKGDITGLYAQMNDQITRGLTASVSID